MSRAEQKKRSKHINPPPYTNLKFNLELYRDTLRIHAFFLIFEVYGIQDVAGRDEWISLKLLLTPRGYKI